MKTAGQVTKKWVAAMSNATQAYKDGITSTDVDPTALAAQNTQGYLNGVQNAVNTGKFQRGLQRAGKNGWQQGALNKGASKLASGAQAASPKMDAFNADFIPFTQSVKAQIRAMPNATKADRKARLDKAYELMSGYKRP